MQRDETPGMFNMFNKDISIVDRYFARQVTQPRQYYFSAKEYFSRLLHPALVHVNLTMSFIFALPTFT